MIPIKSITITRAEGPNRLCGKPHVFDSYAAASTWLLSQSNTFPASGGYDKHDFTVIFEDGETYSGRLDCKAYSCPDNDLDVYKHMLDLARWMSGREMFPHCGQERYKELIRLYEKDGTKKAYKEFMDKYLICPDGELYEVKL